MKRRKKNKLSIVIWLLIIAFLAIVLSFPQWIIIFYPEPHRDIVFTAADEHNIDPYLVFAIIRAESKYQTTAKSHVGARGLMQIMPETATWIAAQNHIEDFALEDLHDPGINIKFGSWYIANLMQEYEELPLAIAAYNAGRGTVKSWMEEGIWEGNPEELDKIPFPETRKYVENVLKNYTAYLAIYT